MFKKQLKYEVSLRLPGVIDNGIHGYKGIHDHDIEGYTGRVYRVIERSCRELMNLVDKKRESLYQVYQDEEKIERMEVCIAKIKKILMECGLTCGMYLRGRSIR